MVMDVDVNTGEINNREMTDAEYAVYLQDQKLDVPNDLS